VSNRPRCSLTGEQREKLAVGKEGAFTELDNAHDGEYGEAEEDEAGRVGDGDKPGRETERGEEAEKERTAGRTRMHIRKERDWVPTRKRSLVRAPRKNTITIMQTGHRRSR
jgi:hypothetical protein